MKILKKIHILLHSLYAYLIKFKIDIFGVSKKYVNYREEVPIIVSLTSYGRRVKSVVYYTLVSLLNQSVRPYKIILWLDNSWNDDILPKKLHNLREYGIEVKYCRDIRSYKKLIPTLLCYPDFPILTVDDDIMYVPNFIESLFCSYSKYPDKIHCTHALKPLLLGNNRFEQYIKWPDLKNGEDSDYVFPIGEGGILYPPYSLNPDVVDEDLIFKLCPNADDIWFWIMAIRMGTTHKLVDLPISFYSFDAIYQYFHKGSALTHSNAKESMNDSQLKQVINYYKLNF